MFRPLEICSILSGVKGAGDTEPQLLIPPSCLPLSLLPVLSFPLHSSSGSDVKQDKDLASESGPAVDKMCSCG